MEFSDMLMVFKQYRRSFFTTVVAVLLLGVVWQQFFQKKAVTSNLTLNITRLGSEQTSAYQYNDFYRLQADERFADTVARWLTSPRLVSDIYERSELNADALSESALMHAIKAERLSSQTLQVTYTASNDAVARKLSQAIIERVNTETKTLNRAQQESSWFTVIGSEPVIRDARKSLSFVVLVSLLIGIFLGFWRVLFRYYAAVEAAQRRR